MRRRGTAGVSWAAPAVVAALIAVAAPLPAAAVVPGPNGPIVFLSDRDGNTEIYRMNGDGTDQTRLTTHPRNDGAPAFSPDGTRIAFTSDRDGDSEIYVMNADGSGETRLTTSPGEDSSAAFSPDGTRIAFSSGRDELVGEIYVMNADGTGQTRLTTNPGGTDIEPAFSPDGSRIAFASTGEFTLDVFVMNADGTNRTQLTTTPGEDRGPSFSPDGARIAFTSERDGNYEIYTMNADGTGQTRLTADPADEVNPGYSPDGTSLVFDAGSFPNQDVHAVNVDGTNRRQLTSSPGADFAPDWGTVAAVAPTAADDIFTTTEDTPLTVPAPGVLGNDTDPDSVALTAAVASGPANGALTLATDGSFSYVPNPNFTGTDTFTYTARDATASSGPATVILTVTAVDDAPVAAGDAYPTAEDTPLSVPAPGVLGNDTDPDSELTAAVVTGPTSGALTLGGDGSFTYLPNRNFAGTDTFTYTAGDGVRTTTPATVTLTISPVNDAPVAGPDSYRLNLLGRLLPLSVPAPGVLANDSDVEGDPMTAVLVAGPGRGTLTLGDDGSFTYRPRLLFIGTDSFTYRAQDRGGARSAPVTVTLRVSVL